MQSRTVLVVLTMAACTAFALDAACVDITIPPQAIDFNTAFTPQIAVMNNGPEFLFDVPVRFVIVRTSDPTDTIYRDTAHSGAISTYDTKLVNFTLECTPDPDSFTMTGITELSGDVNRHNDTCSKSLFVRYWDVATEIVRPGEHEQPGLVSVQVRLTNMGTVPALVPRVDVKIAPSGYHDWREHIPIGVGSSQSVTLNPWVCVPGRYETCTAYVTHPADSNHTNDTDVVVVQCGDPGLSGDVGMDLSRMATGSIARAECGLVFARAAHVTFYDVGGRVVLKRRLGTAEATEFPLNLRSLSPGVYVVRLDDGHQSVVQKLVVQR